MNFLKKNIKINVIITILVLLIFNSFYFFYVKDLSKKKNLQIGNHYNYEFNIYVKPSKKLLEFSKFYNENFGVDFIKEKYFNIGSRNDHSIYMDNIIEIFESKGFSEVNLTSRPSLFFFFTITLNFKDKSFFKDFNFDENLKEKIIDQVIFLENKILEKKFEILNIEYTLENLSNELDNHLKIREDFQTYLSGLEKEYGKNIEIYLEELFIENRARRKYNTLKNFNNYLQKNKENLVSLEQSSLKKNLISSTPHLQTQQWGRINLINLNLGALLITILIILLHEIFKDSILKLNRKKK